MTLTATMSASLAVPAKTPASLTCHEESRQTRPHILVTDTFNNRVQVFDLDGNYVSQFGGSGSDPGQFLLPYGITTNSTHILVTETTNNRIQIFDTDGNYQGKFGSSGTGDGQFDNSVGVAITPMHILVADLRNHRIQVFDLDGSYVSQFGSEGTGDYQFNLPQAITTNSTHLLVADRLNHRIQIFDLAPTVVITADTPNGRIHNSDTVSYTATFTEDVTGFVVTDFDVTDVTVSGTASGGTPVVSKFAGSGNTYTFDVATTSEGTVMVSIPKLAATDTAGNANHASTAYSVTVSDDAPIIREVSAKDGLYREGHTVVITVTFDESVTVTGEPQLLLDIGTGDVTADYNSGSGGTDIIFQYTVAAGHDSADLNYVGTDSLSLNGGSIVATAGDSAPASLTLPATTAATSLAGTSAVIVDSSPTVIITSDIPDGGITTSTIIFYTATFSEVVTDFGDDTTDVTVTGLTDTTVSTPDGTRHYLHLYCDCLRGRYSHRINS